ncbi:MAG: heavy-metal-associated domain-containing protein [Aureispira sp.]
MKNTTLIFISIFFLFNATQSHAQKTKTAYDNFTVMVKGLGCPFCAYGLEKKFKELKGLQKPVIDMETGKFTFKYPAEKKMSIAQVERQVDAAGYTAIDVVIDRASGVEERSNSKSTTMTNENELTQKQLSVSGNCEMCQARIEKIASKIKGVNKASWNVKTKVLKVSFDSNQTSIKEIASAVAKSGHDNSLAKANNTMYEKLPPCCLYR